MERSSQKDFSIILNSRGRPQLLQNLLFSLQVNTYDLSRVEVLIGIDDDDTSEDEVLDKFSWVTPIRSPRNKNLHQKLNQTARHANGVYIFVFNDDCRMITYGWDIIAKSLLDNYLRDKPDGIVLGQTQDNSVDKIGTYSSFPIISKKAVDCLGIFMNEEFPAHGGDVVIDRIYRSVNRVLPLDIHICHSFHDEPQKKLDITGNEMRQTTFQNRMDYYDFNIEEYTRKLNELISNTPS